MSGGAGGGGNIGGGGAEGAQFHSRSRSSWSRGDERAENILKFLFGKYLEKIDTVGV